MEISMEFSTYMHWYRENRNRIWFLTEIPATFKLTWKWMKSNGIYVSLYIENINRRFPYIRSRSKHGISYQWNTKQNE